MTDIPNDVKLQIINNEIAMYNNTIYLLQIRHRVNKSLGQADALKTIEDEMVKNEKSVDELEKIKSELDAETKK